MKTERRDAREPLSAPSARSMVRRGVAGGIVCAVLALTCACTSPHVKGAHRHDQEVNDVVRLPQEIAPYASAAGERLAIDGKCRTGLLEEFRERYFIPWTRTAPQYDVAETRDVMRKTARGTWYGENRRIMVPKLMQDILDNCALESFPSRNETAIAAVPTHLRGLPTRLPLFSTPEDYPFDMLQYPNVKLNEPLRVLHASRDGIWLFVENSYSAGWLEARDVALVDRSFIDSWMARPQLVIVRDYTTVTDRWGIGHRAKIGTILPLAASGEGWWEVEVASAGEAHRAVTTQARLPHGAAARLPLDFNRENLAMIGNQLMGQPYGWGEVYDLRDCSAMLRDFFLPFGIWLPRTSADQIASTRLRRDLAGMTPQEKEETIRREGRPFLTLVYKPGHIMLYVGTDPTGQPLVFHDAWSVRVKEAEGERVQYIGKGVVTTLEPGKELGVPEGATLLEQGTALATITDRCTK